MMINVMLFVSNGSSILMNLQFWNFFYGLFVSGDEGNVEYYEEDEEREKKNSRWWFIDRYNGPPKSNRPLLKK